MNNIFDTCAIIGTGLIGASIGIGVKENGTVKRVVGIGRNQTTIDTALRRGTIDFGTLSVEEGVTGADIVIIGTPVSMIPGKIKEAIPHLKDGAILTDAGSTKTAIMREFNEMYAGLSANNNVHINFIGGHPIAGSEKKGPEYADPSLYEGSICVLTPSGSCDDTALAKLNEFWTRLGANVIVMPPEKHDEILSITSHLPQLAAYALTNIVQPDQWKFSGGGLKDCTRIASSDPKMWADICGQNEANISASIDLMIKELSGVKDALKMKDWNKLEDYFAAARDNRDAFYNK